MWWAVTDSNRRHSACKADALPTELTARARPPWRDLSPRCSGTQVRRCGDAAQRRPVQAQVPNMTPPACALLAWQRADGRRMLRDPLPGPLPIEPDCQIASLSSLEARKATFLLALIWMASPVAGLRPMRAARL